MPGEDGGAMDDSDMITGAVLAEAIGGAVTATEALRGAFFLRDGLTLDFTGALTAAAAFAFLGADLAFFFAGLDTFTGFFAALRATTFFLAAGFLAAAFFALAGGRFFPLLFFAMVILLLAGRSKSYS